MKNQINGIGINYLDTGNKSGIPIVLIHGMTFDHTTWLPQIELLERDHRVIAFDLRGHGKSDVGDGQYTYRHFVEDLVGLLDLLEVDSAVLCGLSMGGAIAMRTCLSYPERVRALIVCDSTCGPDTEDSKRGRELAVESIKRDGLEPFARDFLKKVFAPSTLISREQLVEAVRKIVLSSSPLGVCGTLIAQAARLDLCPKISEIAVPTLLVVGAEDALTPPPVMENMRDRIRGAKLAVIGSAGHVTNLENTAEFNRQILDFLSQIPSDA